MSTQLLTEQFAQLNHQDKYDKLMIYLHAAQKSEKNLIWLYALVSELGVEKIDDTTLIELYDAFVSLVEYGSFDKVHKVTDLLNQMKQMQEKEKNDRSLENAEADDLLLFV
jgi:hypothetical protein